MADNEPAAASGTETRGGTLGVQKVYLKDLSYEAPHTPQIFTEEWKPALDVQLGNSASQIGPGMFEVVLSVTVTVKFPEKVAYLIEVKEAGIFNISGFPEKHLGAILSTVCPNILFPFAREVVANTVTKAGFPQLLLAPVNFEALAAQERMRQQNATDEPASGTPVGTIN